MAGFYSFIYSLLSFFWYGQKKKAHTNFQTYIIFILYKLLILLLKYTNILQFHKWV